MRDIAIIGAGELGGALAQALAARDLARRIRLVDSHGRIAEGKALDISQSAPILGFAAELTGSSDVATAGGASLVIVADAAAGTARHDEEALGLLRRAHHMSRQAIIVCANPTDRELVERGCAELGIDRRRLLGSAPEAMRAAARALVALELGVSPREVSLSLLGVPPRQIVISWDGATASGLMLTRLLSEPRRRQLAARIDALWPPGPTALAYACCAVVEGIAGRARPLPSCFVAPDRSNGVRTRAAALPVRLGAEGIVEVVMPPLSVVERVALDNAVNR
jgi:malate dehydrogenase